MSYHALGMTAQGQRRFDEAEKWFRKSLDIKEELGDRPGLASAYHELGVLVQSQGRLDEAEEWCHRSLAIKEEHNNRPGQALTYAQLGLLAEDRFQPVQALAWNVRSVTLFAEFPSPLTAAGATALARLTRQLGLPALEETWRQVTGRPVPRDVLDYIATRQDQQPVGAL